MDRVDLPVGAAADVMRRQRAGAVRLIVAPTVVVLDFQIAVEQQALRDDEVVRLVAAWNRRRHLPRGKSKDGKRAHARRELRPVPHERLRTWKQALRARTAGDLLP